MKALDVARFHRLYKRGKADECWLRNAQTNTYGRFWLDGRSVGMHRIAYHLANPKWPLESKEMVCHSCDNKRCVNPKHLSLGTNASNVLDAWERGRRKRKFSRTDITKIKALYLSGVTQVQIGKLYGCRQGTINNLIHERTRKDYPRISCQLVLHPNSPGD